MTADQEARVLYAVGLMEKWLEQNVCQWPDQPCNYKCNGGCGYWKGFVSR